MNKIVEKITNNKEVNKKLKDFFTRHILEPQKIINKSFILTKSIGNLSKTFDQYRKTEKIQDEKTVKEIIKEVDDRLEEIKNYLKPGKDLFKKASNEWNKLNLPSLYNNHSTAFNRYMFYANCHIQYFKILEQQNDYKKILSHHFECIFYLIYIFGTSYFNAKQANTEFLRTEMSVFVEENISMEDIKYFSGVLIKFDSDYMNQIIELISCYLRCLFSDLSNSLGGPIQTHICNIFKKRNIVEDSGYKEFTIKHMDHLLYEQYATADEKLSVNNASKEQTEMYKKIILDRIMSEHKKRIESEII